MKMFEADLLIRDDYENPVAEVSSQAMTLSRYVVRC